MTECPSCAGALAPDDKFCGGCGAPVPEEAPVEVTDAAPESAEAAPGPPLCAACGGEISTDARFCGHCGATIAGGAAGAVIAGAAAMAGGTAMAGGAAMAMEPPTTVVPTEEPPTSIVAPSDEPPTTIAAPPEEALTVVTPPVAASAAPPAIPPTPPTHARVTGPPSGPKSSRNKIIAIVAAVAVVAAIIGAIAYAGRGNDPGASPTGDGAAYDYSYDESAPSTGYDDTYDESGPSMGYDDTYDDSAPAANYDDGVFTEEDLYGFWSGSLYVKREMNYGDRWRKSAEGSQTAYISIDPYANGSYGEFTVEPTSGASFSGNATDISIEGDVAVITIYYADFDTGATLRVSLQDGSSLVGFYADDPPPADGGWVSWKGDVELPRFVGE